MKKTLFSTVVLALALSPFAMAQDDGATLFKSKCAGCHGPNGEGKVGPALKDTKLSDNDIVIMLTKGKEGAKAPHTKPVSGLSDEQVKALAHFVKSLK